LHDFGGCAEEFDDFTRGRAAGGELRQLLAIEWFVDGLPFEEAAGQQGEAGEQ
jgi:hypothetical protein